MGLMRITKSEEERGVRCMSSGVPGPCFYLNISLKSQCLTSVLSLATEKKIWLLYFQVPISIRQAQEVMWCLKCAKQRSQQFLNVLERGVKSINLLGESLSQQTETKVPYLWAPGVVAGPVPALAPEQPGHKAGEDHLEGHWEGILQENLAGHCPAMWPGQAA